MRSSQSDSVEVSNFAEAFQKHVAAKISEKATGTDPAQISPRMSLKEILYSGLSKALQRGLAQGSFQEISAAQTFQACSETAET